MLLTTYFTTQTFAWMNKYTQCRGMNEARFFWYENNLYDLGFIFPIRFFLYLIDMRNNAKEKKLRMLLGKITLISKKLIFDVFVSQTQLVTRGRNTANLNRRL